MGTDVNLLKKVSHGFSVDEGAAFMSGAADPDFDAPVGTMYLKTDGTRFLKLLSGTGTDKWSDVLKLNTIVPIYLKRASGHIHTVFLTQKEADDLMSAAVSSVVKNSSTNSAHNHSVTITFNSLTDMFQVAVASGGSPSHTHKAIPQNNVAVIPIFHQAGTTGHIHTNFLTQQEAQDLMTGTIASVVKNSSTDSFHFHETTITWDSTRSQFLAVSASGGSPAHIHATSAAGMSPFGSSFHIATSTAESTTTSGTFQTKLTLTTSSLPLGDYIVFFSCGASNSGGKLISVEFRRGTTRLRLAQFQGNYSAPAGEYSPVEAHDYVSQISGVQTFDIRHRQVDGNTARIGDASIVLWRVQ